MSKALTGARILVVEDDEMTLDMTSGMLERALSADGAEIVSSSSANKALEMAEGGDFALLVIDLVMPELSGIELADELRRRGCQTPVLFVSGYVDHEFAQQLEFQANRSFLAKPFEAGEIEAKARQMIKG